MARLWTATAALAGLTLAASAATAQTVPSTTGNLGPATTGRLVPSTTPNLPSTTGVLGEPSIQPSDMTLLPSLAQDPTISDPNRFQLPDLSQSIEERLARSQQQLESTRASIAEGVKTSRPDADLTTTPRRTGRNGMLDPQVGATITNDDFPDDFGSSTNAGTAMPRATDIPQATEPARRNRTDTSRTIPGPGATGLSGGGIGGGSSSGSLGGGGSSGGGSGGGSQ